MSATLLLMILETGEVHTAVHYPSYTACVEAMHEAVERHVGIPLIYLDAHEAYTDEAGTYILFCEGDLH